MAHRPLACLPGHFAPEVTGRSLPEIPHVRPIRHFSFTLDAAIILKTIHVMILGKGR